MDNAVDTGTILEDVASGDAASLVGGWMKASWGMLSVEKILWTVLLLAVCLVCGLMGTVGAFILGK